jgi:hypothetical protein
VVHIVTVAARLAEATAGSSAGRSWTPSCNDDEPPAGDHGHPGVQHVDGTAGEGAEGTQVERAGQPAGHGPERGPDAAVQSRERRRVDAQTGQVDRWV